MQLFNFQLNLTNIYGYSQIIGQVIGGIWPMPMPMGQKLADKADADAD